MQRKDFKPCAGCGKGVMHTGLPLFYRVRVERMGVDRTAAQRQHGLEQFLGSVALADVMGDGAPVASPLANAPCELLLCEACAVDPNAPPLAALIEREETR